MPIIQLYTVVPGKKQTEKADLVCRTGVMQTEYRVIDSVRSCLVT